MAWLKAAAVVVGLSVTLLSTGLGLWRWASARVRADVEREQVAESQAARLDVVEAGLGDVEKVMQLERLERAQTQTMLRMILQGQGQVPPASDEVEHATEEIDAILAE